MRKLLSSFLISLFVLSPALAETSNSECMPGWNATLMNVRAIQRAHSCSLTGNLSDCQVQMGVGALAVSAAAAKYGKDLAGKAIQAIRDVNSRPCPFVASKNSLSFLILEQAYAAGCTPQIEIERARVSNAMDVVAEEMALRKQQAESTLAEMEKIQKEIASANGPDRAAKIKAAIDRSAAASMDELTKANKAVETQKLSRGWQELSNQSYDAAKTKSAKMAELKTLMRNWLQLPLDDTPYNYDEITKNLQPSERERLLKVRKDMLAANTEEYLSRRSMSTIEAEPEMKRLATRANALNTQTVELKNLSYKPGEFVEQLDKNVNEMKTGISKISASQTAFTDFRAALAGSKTMEDIYAIGSRLHNFIPKELLIDPAKHAVGTALREAASVGARLAEYGGKMTEASLNLLQKYPQLAELAEGGRIAGSLLIRGIALTGGALVSGLTFASNDFGPQKCGEMTTSKIFPRDPKNGCSQDLSVGSPIAEKIFAMDPAAMCQLMKENPEVVSMVQGNYDHMYPQTRAQCGQPMTFAIEGRGQVRYDGKTASIMRPGDPRETIVQFNANGSESGLLFPKTSGRVLYEKLAWNESPSLGSGDRFDRFTHEYRTQVLPMIAEASACCSGEGVTPTAGECSRYGIQASQSRPGSNTRATGTKK